MMRAHRGKQLDWTKPFKLVDTKAAFEQLDTDANQLVININVKAQAQKNVINKKQEIIVPKIQTVKRITEPKKFAKVQPNYIRLTQELNLPKLDSYQLNQVDHVFLQGVSNRFKLNGKVVITPQFLSMAFIQLQRKAGKVGSGSQTYPRQKKWMTQFVMKNFKEYASMPNFEQFTQTFYNYWKNRREELKFPMLRQLWRPAPDQTNQMTLAMSAFRQREKEKRNLRRRVAQDQISQQMEEDFLLATKIAQRLKLRQQLKLKQIQLQLNNFHNQCKQFFGSVNIFGSFDAQSRARDKQKLKKMQNDIENVKKTQSQQEKQNQIQNIPISNYDQKQTIAQFLASIIGQAQAFGFSYDKIFNQKAPIQKVVVAQPQKQPDIEQQKQKCDFMSMRLYREGNTIYRTLNQLQDQTESSYIKYPKDIHEYKAKQLKSYNFGSDDDLQSKDLKRNISISFKKHQLARASSLTQI